MKKFYGILLCLAFMAFKTNLRAQTPCDAIITTVLQPSPQSGQYNYYGAKVSIAQGHSQDITVVGNLIDSDDPTHTQQFTLTIYTGELSAETLSNVFQVSPTASAEIQITSVTNCPPAEITRTYAGVTVTYEINNNILRFNSVEDVSTLLNQLENDYELHNDNYEALYPNLTADQMDSVDTQMGFDEFKPYKDFENLFSGYYSKRSEIENTEIAWLNNNFGGLDPDDIDLTFDNAQNTILNGTNSFKIGSGLYQLTSSGLTINETLLSMGIPNDYNNSISKKDEINRNGIFQTAAYNITDPKMMGYYNAGPTDRLSSLCKTNKKKKSTVNYDNNSKRFELKVAVNSIFVRSGVHGKVVHFKSKNGGWKRSRTEMAVTCGGTIYNGLCSSSFNFADRTPYSGFKNKKELATRRHTQFDIPSESRTVWKTQSGLVASGFDTPGNMSGVLILTF